ncbi:MAG: 3-phosphoserine/phosphohydroxythreonine transaminase [Legionellaceae bacterium]|nr:3-phosphoserine/phosphohydroxythreonine transaminase [Legionellaceae bacterium]
MTNPAKTRPYNFGAGPAMLPEAILLEAQKDLLNWRGTGMSVMEIGHRTVEFMAMMDEAQELLRELLAIPENYHVLFLGGSARTQFAMIPMNFLPYDQQAGYLVSGTWSALAYEECRRLKRAYCVASTEANNFRCVPSPINWQVQDDTAYIYYTSNETINGVRFSEPPQFGDIPLMVDMTSSLLSEPLIISDYGLIFAGAQKNIAPAGLTVVIVRADLLEKSSDRPIPTMLDYRTHVTNKSLYATPPTFNCYMALQMFKWIKAQGGVAVLHRLNMKKAEKLYDYIDNSAFYRCSVEKNSRSIMNVCFNIVKSDLEPVFVAQAAASGLLALKGHKTVGGLRASLYNAMPMAGVDALIDFMQKFSEKHSL